MVAGESFIEVDDVQLQVTQPGGSIVTIKVGRHEIQENGRKQISELRATIADVEGLGLANKIRSGREVRIIAKAKGESVYRVPFAGTITDVSPSPFEADSYDVTAHDFWKSLIKHRVTLKRLGIDAGAAVKLAIEGSIVTHGSVTDPYGKTLEEVTFDYKRGLDAVHALMDRADADAYIDANKVLHFFPRATVASGLSITDDAANTIRPKFHESDQDQVTRLRGFGGQGYSEFYSNLVQAATKTVTTAVKIQKRVDFPRPELARITLRIERVAGSTDTLEVAIQNDLAGSPTGVDVARVVLGYDQQPAALAEVTLDFPEHVVAEVKPWVIIRATGTTGVKVGVVSGGDDTPYAKMYYRYPIIVEVTADPATIAEYGYLDGELKNPHVTTRSEMLELCRADLERRKRPLRTATFGPTEPAWLDAALGTTVSVTAPIIGAAASPWAITRKTHRFAGGGVWGLTVDLAEVVAPADVGNVLKVQEDRISTLERILVPTVNGDVTKLLQATADRGNGSDAGSIAVVASMAWGSSKWAFSEWKS